MPNSIPSTVSDTLVETEYAYGSAQKRRENFKTLVEFLDKWKHNPNNLDSNNGVSNCFKVAERFCNLNFQYGYVSRKDICEQALMKVGLL